MKQTKPKSPEVPTQCKPGEYHVFDVTKDGVALVCRCGTKQRKVMA